VPSVLRLPGVGTAIVLSVLAGCSPAPSAPPASPPSASVVPSSTPVISPSESPSPAPSYTPSAIASATPSASPIPQTDTYAAFVALTGNEVSYTRLRWYWGKAAQARCKKKHIRSEFEWCNAYYYENTHRSGQGTLATDAKIRLLDDQGKLHSGTAAQLAASIRSASWPYYRLWLAGDQVIQVEQVFTP
jgi:hypothetical protein